MNPEVVLATRSPGKIRELRALLGSTCTVRTLEEVGVAPAPDEDAIECHDTFEDNARAKARYFAERCGGRAVLAEDSGLVVDALGGAPGVHSRRWSGRVDLTGVALDDANNALLLERLRDVADRRARYVCVAVWREGSREDVGVGETRGTMVSRPRGAGGFGYDPYFLSDDLGRTFGEVSAAEKAEVSHRGRAVRALLAGRGVSR